MDKVIQEVEEEEHKSFDKPDEPEESSMTLEELIFRQNQQTFQKMDWFNGLVDNADELRAEAEHKWRTRPKTNLETRTKKELKKKGLTKKQMKLELRKLLL